jgi:hypothetical protein
MNKHANTYNDINVPQHGISTSINSAVTTAANKDMNNNSNHHISGVSNNIPPEPQKNAEILKVHYNLLSHFLLHIFSTYVYNIYTT